MAVELRKNTVELIRRGLSFELSDERLEWLNEELHKLLPDAPVVTDADVVKIWNYGTALDEWTEEWSVTRKELCGTTVADWMLESITDLFYTNYEVIDEDWLETDSEENDAWEV